MKQSMAILAVLGLSTWAALPASADERKFTYSYESKTLPQGSWEFEQWVTLQAERETGRYQKWIFREEIEYGLLDRLTTALYFNWEYLAQSGIPGKENEHEVEFSTISSEWKYKVLDGAADPIGLLLYTEVAVGPEEQELEFKVILDKQFGAFRLAYNFVVEFEREEEEEANGETEWEKESALFHTFGISYQANPNFAVGLEAFFKKSFEGNFEHQERVVFYAGPNVHVAVERFWFTLTALKQLDRGSDEEIDLQNTSEYEFRLIVGYNF